MYTMYNLLSCLTGYYEVHYVEYDFSNWYFWVPHFESLQIVFGMQDHSFVLQWPENTFNLKQHFLHPQESWHTMPKAHVTTGYEQVIRNSNNARKKLPRHTTETILKTMFTSTMRLIKWHYHCLLYMMLGPNWIWPRSAIKIVVKYSVYWLNTFSST